MRFCTNVESGVGKRGGSYSEGSRRVEHDGETSGAEKRPNEQQQTTKNRAEDCFFFISINHMNKLMGYRFIYLKCNMVQKYRRSAAPRYIYKINTPK